MRHFESYLASKGRRTGGWDEIVEDGLSTNALVFCWHVGDTAKKAAEAGYEVVMCPEEYCYFDFQQGLDDGYVYHPRGYKVFPALTVEKVCSFNPLAGIPSSLKGKIIGAQANNWTELTLDEKALMWKIWPRATAFSKVLSDRKKGDCDDESE
jgi:hexosaminidase